MNDIVDIGIFARGVRNTLGTPIYLARHRIVSGPQTIRITLPAGSPAPARAGIDPYRKLIDANGDDNVAVVGSR